MNYHSYDQELTNRIDGFLYSTDETLRCAKCRQELKRLTVRKENHNHGRPFVSCKACDFFAWLDGEKCMCGEGFLEWNRVKKPGANKGRTFACCRWCDHFRWGKK